MIRKKLNNNHKNYGNMISTLLKESKNKKTMASQGFDIYQIATVTLS